MFRQMQLPKRKFYYPTCLILSLLITAKAEGLTLLLPPAGNDVVGEIKTISFSNHDTLSQIARKYDIGIQALHNANPFFSSKKSTHNTILLPTAFILPATPRNGIVINLAELRLYFYVPEKNEVVTYPIGVGREGWGTPLCTTSITNKEAEPTWFVPESIRNYHYETHGELLPEIVPPGSSNPLGHYALHLSLSGYLIHGTNQPNSIGKRSSSGCIRMYPEDIEELFAHVSSGLTVTIIHAPYKIGWFDNQLFFEAHKPFPEYDEVILAEIFGNLIKDAHVSITWPEVEKAIIDSRGYPILIGKRLE